MPRSKKPARFPGSARFKRLVSAMLRFVQDNGRRVDFTNPVERDPALNAFISNNHGHSILRKSNGSSYQVKDVLPAFRYIFNHGVKRPSTDRLIAELCVYKTASLNAEFVRDFGIDSASEFDLSLPESATADDSPVAQLLKKEAAMHSKEHADMRKQHSEHANIIAETHLAQTSQHIGALSCRHIMDVPIQSFREGQSGSLRRLRPLEIASGPGAGQSDDFLVKDTAGNWDVEEDENAERTYEIAIRCAMQTAPYILADLNAGKGVYKFDFPHEPQETETDISWILRKIFGKSGGYPHDVPPTPMLKAVLVAVELQVAFEVFSRWAESKDYQLKRYNAKYLGRIQRKLNKQLDEILSRFTNLQTSDAPKAPETRLSLTAAIQQALDSIRLESDMLLQEEMIDEPRSDMREGVKLIMPLIMPVLDRIWFWTRPADSTEQLDEKVQRLQEHFASAFEADVAYFFECFFYLYATSGHYQFVRAAPGSAFNPSWMTVVQGSPPLAGQKKPKVAFTIAPALRRAFAEGQPRLRYLAKAIVILMPPAPDSKSQSGSERAAPAAKQ